MNIEKTIAFYLDTYPKDSYRKLARRIINNHPNCPYSYEWLRKLISNQDTGLEETNNELSEEDEQQIAQLGEDLINTVPFGEMSDRPKFYEQVQKVASYYNNNLLKELNFTMGIDPVTEFNSKVFFNMKPTPVSSTKNYLVLGCIHFPFHNKDFWSALLKLVAEQDFTGIVLAGDIIDNHSISRHNKGKITIPGLTLEEEYALTNRELDRLDVVINNRLIEKHYFYGNHEMWYYDYMSQSDNHKLGQSVVASPEVGLRLKDRGYKVQNNYKSASLMLGDCEVIHGVYTNLHAAHNHAQRLKRSVLFFHTHRLGRYDESSLEAINGGWLGDEKAPVFGYCTRWEKENWKNGGVVVHVDSNNKSHMSQLTWKNNRFFYGGKEYTA
jgi:hypothetical protein